jgi:galactokinase
MSREALKPFAHHRSPLPDDSRIFSAPARVNLVGEHTDYTGGLVMPMAIPFYTTVQLEKVHESLYSFESDLFGQRTVSTEDELTPLGEWSDYPFGVLSELQKLGLRLSPFKALIQGDVPLGAGLSSSASIEVATCLALLHWAGATLPIRDIALLCQRAENCYVGSPCGIMDQTVITAAIKNNALLIHTRDLMFEPIPMTRGGFAEACIVVCNSEVKHSVATGEYGSIRRQMEAGQAVLRERFPSVLDLGMATLEQLDSVRDRMSTESYKRCKHVITENARVLKAREAMLDGNVTEMGQLMTAAHNSQRDDLGTSCHELDFLVDAALKFEGCYGARMTGGGFGGCTVNLVMKDKAGAFSDSLRGQYKQRFDVDAESWICEAEEGAVARNSFYAGSAGDR